MSSKLVRVFRDFSGGLSEVANDNMNDNELVVAVNVVPGERTGLARAPGTVNAYPRIVENGDGAGDVRILVELAVASDDVRVLAFCDAENEKMDLFSYDAATSAWEKILSNTPAVLDWFIYANKLHWLNGTDFLVYDGTSVESVTEDGTSGLWSKVKTAVAVEQRGQRWFFGTTENEVIFSDSGKVNKLTGTNILNITSGNADTITALHEFNDGLLIFQTRSVYFLEGWDLAGATDVRLSRLNVTTGTRWPKTVKTIENAVLYLGSNGIYQLRIPSYSTKIAATNISVHKISDRLNKLEKVDCYAGVWDGAYYLGIRTADTIVEYRFFTETRGFYGEYTQGATCYAPGFMGADYMTIGCGNGYVLRYDPDSFSYISLENGGKTGIPIEIWSKSYDVVGGMVFNAKLKKAFIVMKQFVQQSTTLKAQIKADYVDQAWEWTMDFDESLVLQEGHYGETFFGFKDTVEKEISISRKAKRMQYRFSDDSMDQPILLYGMGVLYKKKKPKGNRSGVAKTTPDLDE